MAAAQAELSTPFARITLTCRARRSSGNRPNEEREYLRRVGTQRADHAQGSTAPPSVSTSNEQASAQAVRQRHCSESSRMVPATTCLASAAVGHADTQNASRHLLQARGRSTPSDSSSNTLMRAEAVPHCPSWRATHATSQARQPLRSTWRTRICFTRACPHVAGLPPTLRRPRAHAAGTGGRRAVDRGGAPAGRRRVPPAAWGGSRSTRWTRQR